MAHDSIEILNTCLRAIERQEATLDDLVARYPDIEGLRAMLSAALAVRALSRPTLSAATRDALEQQLVAKMVGSRQSRRLNRQFLRVPITIAASLILILITGAGLVRASDQSVPGDALYGVKRISEQITLALANSPSQSHVLTHIAMSRLYEITVLAKRGQFADSSLLSEAAQSLTAAVAVQPDPAVRDSLYQQGEQVLESLSARGQPAAPLAAALDKVATQTPTITFTTTPTSTSTLTFTPTLTATPIPTLTATLTVPDVPPTLSIVKADGENVPTLTATPEPTIARPSRPTRRPTNTPPAQPTAKKNKDKDDKDNGNKGNDKNNGKH